MVLSINQLNLKTKLTLGFSVPIIVMFIITLLIYNNVNNLLKANFWVNHTHKVIAEGEGLVASMVDMETGMRGFLVAGREEFLEPYKAGKLDFTKNITKLKQTVSDNPKQVTRLEAIEALSNNWLQQSCGSSN